MLKEIERQITELEFQEEDQVTENCEICYKSFNRSNHQKLRPASICYECWHEHIKTNVTKISYMIGSQVMSPFQGDSSIDITLALNSLKDEDKKQLEEWLFKKYTTFTKDVQKCPSQTCDYAFLMDKCKWIVNKDHKCPKCQMPLTVSQNLSLKSILGFIYFILIANKCPKCQIPIQRISGCPHMTCPCGHQFCWFCLKDHAYKNQNLYSVHQPKQCVFIFISKIIIFLTCITSLSSFMIGGETIRQLMDLTFSGLFYLVYTLILDLFIACQFLFINLTQRHPYRYSKFHRLSNLSKILIFVLINLIGLGILYLIDQLFLSLMILFGQLIIVLLVAGSIIAIVYSVQTWFQFIA